MSVSDKVTQKRIFSAATSMQEFYESTKGLLVSFPSPSFSGSY